MELFRSLLHIVSYVKQHLPVHLFPFPENPGLHVHPYEPGTLLQTAKGEQS